MSFHVCFTLSWYKKSLSLIMYIRKHTKTSTTSTNERQQSNYIEMVMFHLYNNQVFPVLFSHFFRRRNKPGVGRRPGPRCFCSSASPARWAPRWPPRPARASDGFASPFGSEKCWWKMLGIDIQGILWLFDWVKLSFLVDIIVVDRF